MLMMNDRVHARIFVVSSFLVIFSIFALAFFVHPVKADLTVTFGQTGLYSDYPGTVLTINGSNYLFGDFPIHLDCSAGDVFTFSYTSPLTVDSGKQYRWDSTTGLSNLQSDSITVTASDYVTGNYVVQYFFSVTSPDGAPNPSSGWFDNSSSITESVTSPVAGGPGTQYACTGWSGTGSVPSSGTNSSVTFTINTPTSIVWNWNTQYQVTFDQTGVGPDFTGTVATIDSTNYGSSSLPVSFWWDDSSSHSFSYASPLTVGSKNYAWSATSGLSAGQSGALIISAPGSVIGSYIVQNEVTFDQTGVSPDFAGTVVVIDSVSYSQSQLPLFFSWTINSVHSFAFQSLLVVGTNSKQYVWTSTTGLSSLQSDSITVSSYGSIIGTYKTQYYFTVTSTHDSPSPSNGWFDSGSSITDSVASPVAGPTQTQYVCTGWTGTGFTPSSGSTSSVTFTITQASSITWNWKTQYYFTVSTQYGSPSPASGWFDSGTSLAELIDSPQNGAAGKRYVCTGWTGTGSTSGTGTGTTVMFTITTASSITWNWKNQYYLTVTSAYGLPSPTSNWFDAASALTVSVNSPVAGTSGTRYVCTGWTGTGDVASTGGSNSTKFTINSPSTITWNWQFQYQLTMSSNFGSTIPSGTNWYIAGSTVTVSASPPNASLGEQYVWNSWTGIGTGSFTGSTTSPTLTMNGPVNETAAWTRQYRLTVSSAHGTPTPNSEWVNVGTQVTETLSGSPSAGSAGTQYVCTGWSGTGNSPASGSSLSVTFNINTPSTITWNWKTQYQLTISSAYSTTTGSGWYDSGSEAYATLAEATVPGSSGIQYTFTGWTGDASGSTLSSNTITMDAPKTAVAAWVTQYYLTVTSIYSTPSGSGWYSSGSTAYASVANASITEADMRYVFTGWTGDASGADYSQSNAIIMNNPKTATAQWTEAQVALTILPPLGSVGGYTQPNTGVYPQNDTSPITVAATSNTGYSFDHWLLDDQNAADNPITVTMTTDHTLVPVFQPLNFTLTILASNNGTTNPAAGNITYTYGTNATVLASPNTGYQFDHWLFDGAPVSANPITIAIDGDHTLQPVYQLAPSTKPPESSQLLIYLYVLGGVFVAAIAVFALIVFIKRRT